MVPFLQALTVVVMVATAEICLAFVAPYTDVSLNGPLWTAQSSNQSITVPGTVPGDIYGDLIAAGVLTQDPFYRFNDFHDRWVAFENWTYTSEPILLPQSSNNTAWPLALLVFNGIQVASAIYANDVWLGNSSDQFQEYRFNVTSIVNAPNTTSLVIRVAFTSTVLYAKARAEAYQLHPFPYAPPYYNGSFNHRNFFRGEQSSFGWDWGPAFAPTGLYKDVTLRLFSPSASVAAESVGQRQRKRPSRTHKGRPRGNKALDSAFPPVSMKIDHVTPHMFPLPYHAPVTQPLTDSSNAFWIRFRIYFTVAPVPEGAPIPSGTFVVSAPSLNNATNTSTWTWSPPPPPPPHAVSPEDGLRYDADGLGPCAIVDLYVANVSLWWPRGYGPATQHNVTVEFFAASGDGIVGSGSGSGSGSGVPIDVATILLGVRSIELITFGDPKKWGDTNDEGHAAAEPSSTFWAGDGFGPRPVMYFRVNGFPVFAKGANLVPFDAFQSRVNDTVMEDILDSAVAANMNMVRVWGGGIFPLDSFYEMADRKGLLLWQEMIFACSEYPVDSMFLLAVRREIRHQLRRLGRHASVAMWSGNNENGVYDTHNKTRGPYELLDYRTVLEVIISEDASRPIWPSSPSNGFASGVTDAGLPAGTQEHPLPFVVGGRSGDTHFYNYFSCPNVELYPPSNFASEFGFQSLPWLDNFRPVSRPEDWSLFSPLMNHRQHHPDGNEQMAALLQQNFQVPDLNSTALAVFRRVIYLSQLQQTLCIADESSFYRRGRDMFYRTMGSLYWQLNQNWQAPSWTSLEYGGEWKVLHYAMAEVYAPVHLSALFNKTTGDVVAHAASDHTRRMPPAQAAVAVAIVEAIPLAYDPTNPSSPQPQRLFKGPVPTTDGRLPALGGVFFWSANRTALLAGLAAPPVGGGPAPCPSGDGTDCFLFLSLFAGKRGGRGGTGGRVPLAAPQPFWLATVKALALECRPNVSAVVTAIVSPWEANVTLSTKFVAAFVLVRAPAYFGRFSRNAVALVPGRPLALTFTLRRVQRTNQPYERQLTTVAALQAALTVETLNDGWKCERT